jgi:hypothetical protein
MDDSAQSGYYQEIARVFLERRGGPFLLSPKDQSAIAAWEEKKIPLGVVLEGIGRTFDRLKSRGRGTKAISLFFCDREVEAAFAQHRDRGAGRRKIPGTEPRSDKWDKAHREIAKALEALPAGDQEMTRLLREALEALSAARPDTAALDRIEAAIEEILWNGATSAEKAAAEADAANGPKGRKLAGLEETCRRRVVMASRARRRIPHVSPHYY